MSTVNVSDLVTVREELAAALARLDAAIGTSGSAVSGKSKKVRKVSARKGRPTVLGDFTKKILQEHAADVEAYKAANPGKKGAHLSFISEYKTKNAEEWEAYKTEWEASHPKPEKSEATTDAESEAGGSESGGESTGAPTEKKKRVLSPEHLAKLKAGREKKAEEKKKAAAEAEAAAKGGDAPAAEEAKPKKEPKKSKKASEAAAGGGAADVPAPVAEVTEDAEDGEGGELLPFTLGKAKYLRVGTRRGDGSVVWNSGDLWESKKGARGDYVGCLQEDGSIDASAEEPDLE